MNITLALTEKKKFYSIEDPYRETKHKMFSKIMNQLR